MSEVFLKVLNMSIAADWLILTVILLRLLLKRAPKWASVLLWGIVALRLTIPFSFESALSLIPSAETFRPHNIRYEAPVISSGIPAVNNAVNPVLDETFAPAPGSSVNPLYVLDSCCVSHMACRHDRYAALCWNQLRVDTSEYCRESTLRKNIFLCDHVQTPFDTGLVRPGIYLPSGMNAKAAESVIAHEKAHLARRDHWWKPIGFLILTVHWFNPLCWIAYVLLCRDIELACDEKVIRQMNLEEKKQYSAALLECSTSRRLVTVCPLAFGEVGVKERIKTVLHYKKPAVWVASAALAVCAVVAVCFLTDPMTTESPGNDTTAETESDMSESAASKLDGSSESASEEPDVSGSTDEQTAIHQAIMEHNRSSHPQEYDTACCSYVELACLAVDENDASRYIHYGWAMYGEYKVTDNGLETVSGSHVPIAVTLREEPSGTFTIEEYWEPGDGSYYVSDIREKFPAYIAEDGIDSQKFGLQQIQECYAQAAAATGLDTSQVIGALIETICSSPAWSSNPEDYISEHSLEYRELIYYGRYTLEYCRARLENGSETGLEGQIMMRVYEDIESGLG